MHTKRPALAAFLNFVLPGVGYIYVGRRVGFGVVLLLAGLLSLADVFSGGGGMSALWIIAGLLAGAGFAADAWNEAKRVNGTTDGKSKE